TLGLTIKVAFDLPAKRHALLDVIMALALADLWVSSQIPRQAAFPPPPTTAALLASRFDWLFWLGLLFALLSALLWWLGRRAGRLALRAVYAPWLWRWAVLLVLLGL